MPFPIRRPLAAACAWPLLALAAPAAFAAGPLSSTTPLWTTKHVEATIPTGFASEIVSFDTASKTLWVAGVKGVAVLNPISGALLQFIDTTTWGSINSVAIHGGIAAFAIAATNRKDAGKVVLFDTATRQLAAGVNEIFVGSLPDMLTFTPDGSKLLVANEGSPNCCGTGNNDYGPRIGTTTPRNYGYADAATQAAKDPVGSVSIISMASRSVVATPTFAGVVPLASNRGLNVRTNTGMDFEPESIAVDPSGTKAWVTLQEANALALLDLTTNSFSKIVGLGTKNFNTSGNEIDPLNDGAVSFARHAVKGLYMPDGIATYRAGSQTYTVTANEGDFREDDADRSAVGGTSPNPLRNLRISNTDSSGSDLFAAGARSFSIRDANGDEVYDSGSTLDREAEARSLYDDNRSRDKGVEPEGVALITIGGRTYAFIGLERTTQAAIAVFDITDPLAVSFVDMLVDSSVMRPEGLTGFTMNGMHYLAVASEGTGGAGTFGTSVFALAPVPEPGTWALMAAGLLGVGALARRRRG